MTKLSFSKDRLLEARDIRERWYNGEKTERLPFVFSVSDAGNKNLLGANPYNYIEMCASSKTAVEGVILSLQHQLSTFPDCDYLPILDVYYLGQGILAAIYGAEQYIVEKDPPFTKGRIFNNIYETVNLSNDFDIENTVWGRKLKEHVERFVDATDGQIPVGPPDYQSPYGTATKLLHNEELMMAMYDEPELTHQFLERITDGIIKLSDAMQKWAGADNYVHNRSNPIPGKCGCILWDDYISVITPSLHIEFCAPCNRRLYDTYGYGHLHTCGPYFPGYMDACLACSPRSMDISIMRGMSKSKEDVMDFLDITNKNGIRLFGNLGVTDSSIFENKWTQPDREFLETCIKCGWMPSGSGTYEEGLALKKQTEDIYRSHIEPPAKKIL